MRPRPTRLYAAGMFLVVVGAVGLYLGYFYSGTSCDSSSGCHVHAAFTIEPVPLIVGAGFFLFGVYTVVSAWRRRRAVAPPAPKVPGAEWQARLGRDMSAYYTRSIKAAVPSEFDLQMLSLLAGVQGNAVDVDARIESLRRQLQTEGRLQRWRDQGRANAVWRKGDRSLPWIPETWQLRINWARLRVLGPTVASYTMAPSWVAPSEGRPDEMAQ